MVGADLARARVGGAAQRAVEAPRERAVDDARLGPGLEPAVAVDAVGALAVRRERLVEVAHEVRAPLVAGGVRLPVDVRGLGVVEEALDLGVRRLDISLARLVGPRVRLGLVDHGTAARVFPAAACGGPGRRDQNYGLGEGLPSAFPMRRARGMSRARRDGRAPGGI